MHPTSRLKTRASPSEWTRRAENAGALRPDQPSGGMSAHWDGLVGRRPVCRIAVALGLIGIVFDGDEYQWIVRVPSPRHWNELGAPAGGRA